MTRVSFLSIIRFAIRHYWIFFFILFYFPIMVGSVSTAVETRNPAYPFVQLGVFIFNSDSEINSMTNQLREDPSELVIKKEPGIINSIKYYWSVTKLGYRFFAYLFGILIPFVLIYRYNRIKGTKGGSQSSVAFDLSKAILYGFLFIMLINSIMLSVGFMDGTNEDHIDAGLSTETKATYVISNIIPFRGTINLIYYLSGSEETTFINPT